ncbi:hypothetical protein HGA13_27590 [Nocardia speluncae]|uniref:Uncharacterized protein n=1 Tax=Nocardia speluncae TaxID=419477 RepID=A0A846XQ31_9NOCA|nr:hypothetical protein [Nocardia speluncae]NKY36806.1 hypothetical protein [Nocardia speluncae]
MSYIDILVRLQSADHRILMDRAAVKGRTVTELATEVLRAGIHSRAREARNAAWDEYRTTHRIGTAETDAVRAAFVAGWETAHGRVGATPVRRPRNRAATPTEPAGGTIAIRKLASTRAATAPVDHAPWVSRMR